MTKREIEIKLSYAEADVKKYKKLLQKDTIHCYDKRPENKNEFLKYVNSVSTNKNFISHYLRILDRYLEMDIVRDKFDLYYTSQYAMNGSWEKKAKMVKEPFFTILKYAYHYRVENILPESKKYEMIREILYEEKDKSPFLIVISTFL